MSAATTPTEMKTPFLVGARLYLRALEEADITEAYVGWLNDGEVTRYLESSGQFPTRTQDVKLWLEKYRDPSKHLALAVILKEGDRHIGNVTLNNIAWVHRTAWIGIMIGKPFWGQGYATEAESLLLQYAFERLQLHRIVHVAMADNAAGTRLPRTLGFQEEGRLRQHYFVDGDYRDGVVFGLLASEFRPWIPNQQSRRPRREAVAVTATK